MTGSEMVKRIWLRDPKLWHSGKQHREEIANRLGWLSVASDLRESAGDLVLFTREIIGAGFRHAFLLGMGGSSLAPEVLRRVFAGVDSGSGSLELTVLDTTDPVAIRAAEARVDLSRTLFIVSSKSGGTVEVDSLFRYFYERTGRKGSQFIAITDPGTALAMLARDKEFRRVFVNPPDIGGRYSVLSFFGLVPAALVGVDTGRLLDSALAMMRVCGVDAKSRSAAAAIKGNLGFQLGEALGTAALAGRDKVTLVMDPELESMGLWIEQLLAESTGKEGKGLIPVAGEVLGEPDAYGADRVFVSVRLTNAADATASRLDELEAAGHPVVRLKLEDRYDLGGEFFRWEFATAVAGAILGIDPFDQPNVQEAKDRTRQLLDRFVETGELPGDFPGVGVHNLAVQLRSLVSGRDYLSALVFLPFDDRIETLMRGMLGWQRDHRKVATTFGYGPRYLHSTGQLHKGGPDSGAFLLVTCDYAGHDLAIPGKSYTFGQLERAQAIGDLESLSARGRRVVRLHLPSASAADLESLLSRIIVNES